MIVIASMVAGDYDYCVYTLKSQRKSKSTDLHGLTTLARRLAISHAMSTEWEIEELVDLESDPEIKESYSSCLDAYNDAIDQLRDALDNLISKLCFEGISLLKPTLKGVEVRGSVRGCQELAINDGGQGLPKVGEHFIPHYCLYRVIIFHSLVSLVVGLYDFY